MQREKELEAQELAEKISEVLSANLKENDLNEKIAPVPNLYQQYSTDCGIAVDRMVIAYYGFEDPGTDEYVTLAKERDLNIREATGADGKTGPASDDVTTQRLLESKYNIFRRPVFGSNEDQLNGFTQSLINARPILLSFNFHDLHPEDKSTMERSHAVLVKGYRFNSEGQLVIVINDPKPEVGGEIEIEENKLAKALQKDFFVYSNKEEIKK